jgi:hypothetical protein
MSSITRRKKLAMFLRQEHIQEWSRGKYARCDPYICWWVCFDLWDVGGLHVGKSRQDEIW